MRRLFKALDILFIIFGGIYLLMLVETALTEGIYYMIHEMESQNGGPLLVLLCYLFVRGLVKK
jgi:hypothetical protein